MAIFQDIIKDRLINRNQNFLGLFVGETGSGKSVNSASLCRAIDPTFSIENLEQRIAKSPQEFLSMTEGMKRGQLLVWDEAGVSLSSSEWWEQANILVNYVLQTFRHENIGAIFTAPTMKDVDSKARSRFHYIFEVKKINYKTKIATVKVYRRHHNQLTGKTYYPRPMKTYGNITLVLHEIEIPLMPPQVLAKYESIAKPWKQNLKEGIMAQLDEANKAVAITDQEIVHKIMQADLKEIMRPRGKHGTKIDTDIIEYKYGIGARRSVRIAKAVQRQIKAQGLSQTTTKKKTKKKLTDS